MLNSGSSRSAGWIHLKEHSLKVSAQSIQAFLGGVMVIKIFLILDDLLTHLLADTKFLLSDAQIDT